MSTYRHAVIISSYNRPTMVGTAIQSVLSQRASVQVIVADDDSNEETQRAIASALGGRDGCRIIRANRPRDGVMSVCERAVACINDALRLVDAEFVHYLPDDDWFASGRFGAFERFFDANPRVDVAYGRMAIIRNGVLEPHAMFLDCVTTNPVSWIDHGSFSHRASVLERVPTWPSTPHFAFDANFFLALVEAGYEFHPVNHVVNYKTYHTKNLMTERDRDGDLSDRE